MMNSMAITSLRIVSDMPKDRFISRICTTRGAWVAQLVGHLTMAQVMISQFVSSSPALGSVLTAQSLEPALDSVSHSLSALPARNLCLLSLSLFLSLSVSLKNK